MQDDRHVSEPPGENRLETFLLDSAARPRHGRRWLLRALVLCAVVVAVLGAWWGREPPAPDVAQLATALGPDARIPGALGTATLAATVHTLLDKPGGFLANDRLPPGVLLDDMAAFENGALTGVRQYLRALRRDFSRPESGGVEDPDLQRAEPRLLFGSDSWLVPSAESEYSDGLAALQGHHARLRSGGAQFHPRTDGLARWLDETVAQLDAHALRLVDSANGRVPWLQIDDRFYEARGYCWALRVQLLAAGHDFAPALDDGRASLAAALAALDDTQRRVASPLILNGSEYGLLANHSLVLAGHLSRAASALRALRAGLPAH